MLSKNNVPLVLIGASTGGVEAVGQILSDLPADCPPVAVVQHIRHAYTDGLVERLDRSFSPKVVCARHGMPVRPGTIHFAPGSEHHLTLSSGSNLTFCLTEDPPFGGHQPSIDVLFDSATRLSSRGKRVIGVLLTGMGKDGAKGLLSLRKSGARTICQDKESSVVFGMPRVAAEIGAAETVLPLNKIAGAILKAAA